MPFIKATPNVVPVLTPSVFETGKTLIEWDTQGPRGKLFMSVNGGGSTLFDDGGNASGVRSHSTTLKAHLGDEYDLELRQVDAANTLLAHLTVVTRERVALSGGFIDDLRKGVPLLQGIYQLRVDPGPDSVRVRFRTRQATVPVIEVKYVRWPPCQRGVSFPPGARKTFTTTCCYWSRRLPIPCISWQLRCEARQCRPRSRSARALAGWRPSSTICSSMTTATQVCSALAISCFEFGAGEVGVDEPFGIQLFGDEIDSGENRALNLVVATENAPAHVWIQANAQEDDVFGIGFYMGNAVRFAPEGVEFETRNEMETAVVTRWFDLRLFAGPMDEIAFDLATGPLHVSFTTKCRLRVETEPGRLLVPMMKRSRRPTVRPDRVAYLDPGDRTAVGQANGSAWLQRSPRGELYLAQEGDRTSKRPRWSQLGEPVSGTITVAAGADGPHIFALAEDGCVLTLDEGAGRWRRLGGYFVGRIVAVAGNTGITLFGLDCEGAVFQRTEDVPDWRRIADGVAGDLNAFEIGQDTIGLAARGADGDILYRRSTGDRDWMRLGKGPEGRLYAANADMAIVFVVLREDETIAVAIAEDGAGWLDWREFGDVTAMLDRRFSMAGLYRDAG